MRKLQLVAICSKCGKYSEGVEVETYPSKSIDDLNPLFRLLFHAGWGGNGIEVMCSDCVKRAADPEGGES